jgi:hypothetical protein
VDYQPWYNGRNFLLVSVCFNRPGKIMCKKEDYNVKKSPGVAEKMLAGNLK